MTKTKRKKLSVITLGCQMNLHDSEWISGALQDEYDQTDNSAEADFLLVNTCSVRDKASQKFFSLLGRLRPLKQAKKDMVIGVAGCVAQEMGAEIIKREPMVDLVIGTRAIGHTPDLLRKLEETGKAQVDISDTPVYDEFPMRRESSFSAWVSIMRGCDNHCSYCIVPSTRGAEMSRPPEHIVNEVQGLLDQGYKEITLLGQNVNSYGRGLAPKISFPELLRKIDSIGKIERLRFVTSHPKDLSGDLIETMGELSSLCPSLHLPIQSGSDKVLKMMKRGYTAEQYFEKVDKLKARIPDLSLTSDVIVGFPGETDEDFEQTYSAIEKIRYSNIFLFKYSPRPGTPAAKLSSGLVNRKTAQARFERIMSLQQEITREIYNSWMGCEVAVLVEGISKKDASKYTGRTVQNIVVNFEADKDYTGEIIRVKVKKCGQYSLAGTAV